MMGTGIKCDLRNLKKFQKELEKLSEQDMDKLLLDCAKQLALELLRQVKQKTPTKTGLLKNSWQVGNAKKQANGYVVEVFNSVEYASFVEHGHYQEVGRFVPAIGKRLVSNYVEGKHMLYLSVQEVEDYAYSYIEREVERLLKKVF